MEESSLSLPCKKVKPSHHHHTTSFGFRPSSPEPSREASAVLPDYHHSTAAKPTRVTDAKESSQRKPASQPPKGPASIFKNVVHCPVYYPTVAEFENPLQFIELIREEAQRLGICKIVPPKEWRPKFNLAETPFKFSTRLQVALSPPEVIQLFSLLS